MSDVPDYVTNELNAQSDWARDNPPMTAARLAALLKAERERVLAEFEGHYAPSWMAPGDTYTVCIDDMRRIIAKLRAPPDSE